MRLLKAVASVVDETPSVLGELYNNKMRRTEKQGASVCDADA